CARLRSEDVHRRQQRWHRQLARPQPLGSHGSGATRVEFTGGTSGGAGAALRAGEFDEESVPSAAVMTGARERTRSDDEAGFTLVELVVSLILLSVGVFALMQVFYSSLRVTLTADGRTRATAAASREVEAMRSQPYSIVGMNAAQLGAATTCA